MSVRLRASSAATLRWHLECEKLVSPREILVEPLDAVPETDVRNQQNKQVGKKETGFGFPAEEPLILSDIWKKTEKRVSHRGN